MAKVVIFTEGSRQIGMGHLTRSLSLAQALSLLGAEVLFVVAGDDFAQSLVESFKFPARMVPLLDSLKELPRGNIAFVDSYLAGQPFYLRVAQSFEKKLYLDDYFRLDYPEGTILNYIPGLGIPNKFRNRSLLWGENYHLLRREFWEVPPKEVKPEVKNILVTFGGDDIRNLTPKVAEILLKHLRGVNLHTVVGGGFKNREQLLELAKSHPQRVKLHFNLSAEGMKDLMLHCDLAVSAGGQTLFELARVGLPTIAVGVAQNQENNLKGFSKLGFLESPFWWTEENFEEKLIGVLEKLLPQRVRKEKSTRGREIIDGKGALRVARFLLRGG
jgi:spore coat polysaccharide biosynthesis predicted glycosyltransferase SpsG